MSISPKVKQNLTINDNDTLNGISPNSPLDDNYNSDDFMNGQAERNESFFEACTDFVNAYKANLAKLYK